MPTFFKTEAGQLINLDNVDLIKDGRAFFNADTDGTGVGLTKEDERQIKSLFCRSNADVADNAQNFGSLIHSRLEELSQCMGCIVDSLAADKAA